MRTNCGISKRQSATTTTTTTTSDGQCAKTDLGCLSSGQGGMK